MKLHYYKILLFSLSLIILVISSSNAHNKNKPYITIHTPTTTSRVLIECNIYIPNYDYDPDMKSVKENFHKQTEQRFHEYEKRMIKNRQIYKEKCDKDIQQIILKDKLEKELMDKFATLQTDIQNDAIPTCVCEKSLADKVEKGCLVCGCGLGGGVAPFVGLFGGLAVNEMKKAAADAATEAGIKKAIEEVGKIFFLADESTMQWTNMINAGNYSDKMSLVSILTSLNNGCQDGQSAAGPLFCKASESFTADNKSSVFTQAISEKAANAADAARKAASGKFAEMTSVGTIFSDPIVISAIVVVTIAVILLIIYLILRYRRKKQMNKKQQYTKLLNQ
ncbi:hypothetical protein PFFVO_05996 [Plasmodium falciparum Vietnam Oak-Knoll (FVO)]|uniref:Surface antigen n=1 Tax=Plasmodium falciparum Vietnam Oak-Knoll (FVO) TaxID=1036723 RepID=A0A024UXW8_PLAFA|nr:hypothetical protein PFFVO_05996 [Plasmodium falciparum Vietnam Oak-Knoll (FVO)]